MFALELINQFINKKRRKKMITRCGRCGSVLTDPFDFVGKTHHCNTRRFCISCGKTYGFFEEKCRCGEYLYIIDIDLDENDELYYDEDSE